MFGQSKEELLCFVLLKGLDLGNPNPNLLILSRRFHFFFFFFFREHRGLFGVMMKHLKSFQQSAQQADGVTTTN